LLLLLLLLLFFLLLKIVFPIASLRTWIPESVPATRISLLASSSSFIYFSPATAWYPQSSALFRLLCMTWHSCRNVIPVRYDVFYSDFKTDLKLRCECTMKFHLFKMPNMLLLNWPLYIACYYPTTPTDYPRTTRGMSVGHTVTVHIDFCGYLRFFSISFVWITLVQYATDNLCGQQIEFVTWACVVISTHSQLQSKW
jgi:hypothetical protein